MLNECYIGDCIDGMREFVAAGVSVQTCITSPPYWGLRDYGHPDAYGLEASPTEYIDRMVEVFRAVRDVLADDGTLWLNMGDSYYTPRIGGVSGNNSTIKGKGTQEAYKDAQRARNSKVQQSNTASMHGMAMNRRRGLDGMKAKDLVGMPWQLAFALREDGWYLRQDIIWHKPSPMPESVTDRCTKAHEYIFLLSKAQRYYFNANAIKEPASANTHARRSQWKEPDGWDTTSGQGGHGSIHKRGRDKGRTPGVHPKAASTPMGRGVRANESFSAAVVDVVESRNKRSVWTVPSEPYPEAHFATFPRKLIEPCILAGCPLYACASCGRAATDVEVAHGSSTKDMRPMPEAVSTEETEAAVLRQDMLVQVGSQAPENDEGLHHQREGIQAVTSSGESDGEQGRLRHGAQNSDGSSAGAAASPDGSGPPSERNQGRQPTRKSTSAAQNTARQVAKATDQDDTMPALRRDDQSVWSCSSCGCDRVRRGIVLDPFLGSGTTAQVAEQLGRKWIGCEINPEYLALQRERLRQQNFILEHA